MAKFAFFSLVAALSLAASSDLMLHGLSQRTPLAAAVGISANFFGAVSAAHRQRGVAD